MNVAVVKEEAHEGVCLKKSSHIIGKYLPSTSVFYFLAFFLLRKQQFFIAISMLNLLQETTHLELKQTSMLSAVASLTPFSDFNQSPRNMYQCQVSLLIETTIVLGICS